MGTYYNVKHVKSAGKYVGRPSGDKQLCIPNG